MPARASMAENPASREGRKPKAAELVAWEIRRRIINREIVEGENLPPEPELIKQFGVSRPTLREAIRILESQDLIAIDQGQRRGARVHLPSVRQASLQTALLFQVRDVTLKEIMDAWILLEPTIVASLADQRTPDVISTLRHSVEAHQDLAADDVEALERCRRFHQLLLDANSNSAIGNMLGILRGVVELHFDAALISYRPLALQIRDVDVVDRDHLDLIDAIEAGDATKAEQLWRNHIASAGQAITDEFGADTVVVIPQ